MDSVDEEVMETDEPMDLGHIDDQIDAQLEGNPQVNPSYPQLPQYQEELGWQYDMRRSMQEVVPGVYLGPYASATKAKLGEMQAAGLTHIVCVRRILERNFIRANHPENFKYLVVEFADSVAENIIPHLKQVQQFIDECLASGGKVLVHGNAGISLSPLLLIGYIMASYGVTLREAYQFVENKRPLISVKDAFLAQLLEYEPIYRARDMVPLSLPEGEPQRGSVKRTLESDEENTQPNFPRNSDGKEFDQNGH